MERKFEDMSVPTQQQMQEYINGGREGIEHALLLVLIKPRTLTSDDEAELEALGTLLLQYNSLMARYEDPVKVADQLILRLKNKALIDT
jgi:hypothetical protein